MDISDLDLKLLEKYGFKPVLEGGDMSDKSIDVFEETCKLPNPIKNGISSFMTKS